MPVLASGGAKFLPNSPKVIRIVLKGCTNRPFFHIVVSELKSEPQDQCIEQVGSYDPIPNERNQKLVAFNYDRIRYWLGEGAFMTNRTKELLGLAGFLPIHPHTYIAAWKARQAALEPEPETLPKKLTWRHRYRRLLKEAESKQGSDDSQAAEASSG